MRSEKGILGKLLLVAGALLVVIGVFAFQGMSRANETSSTGNGNVGLVIDGDGEVDDEIDDLDEIEDLGEEIDDTANDGCGGLDGNVDDDLDDEIDDLDDNLDNLDDDLDEFDGGLDGKSGNKSNDTCKKKDNEEITNNDEKDREKEGEGEKEPEKELVTHKFTLVYDANGGTGAPRAQTCETYEETCDFVIAEVAPGREGYEFRGWMSIYGDNTNYLAGNVITSRTAEDILILRAVWAEIKTYTLMYDVNGGSSVPDVQSCRSASGYCNFVISEITPSKASAEFLGWQRGEETFHAGEMLTVTETNTVLLASWNPIYTFTLNYTAEEGTEGLPEPQKCETVMGTCTFIVSGKEPTRAGHNFMGWRFEDQPEMLAKAGDELVVAIDGKMDLKVIAVWSKIYTVLNSGEVFGAGERVVLRSAANYGDFVKLVIDMQEVPEEYFSIADSDMTSVMLSNAFSQSLSSGEHAFEITWTNGEASGIISVSQSEDGSKRFVIVDAMGSTEGASLMYRPKAGAVSKESSGVVADGATDNEESNFDAVRTLVLVSVGTFVVVYIVNRFYVRHKMDFIENF